MPSVPSCIFEEALTEEATSITKGEWVDLGKMAFGAQRFGRVLNISAKSSLESLPEASFIMAS